MQLLVHMQKNIFVEKMGLAHDCVMNGNPLKDFGGLHPDPNLTYASHLADLLLIKNLIVWCCMRWRWR